MGLVWLFLRWNVVVEIGAERLPAAVEAQLLDHRLVYRVADQAQFGFGPALEQVDTDQWHASTVIAAGF